MIDATLVTIHGFWSSPATWKRLVSVWSTDKDLHGLTIYPFAYPSPRRPRLRTSTTRIPDYDDIAHTFATEYAISLAANCNIAIVTHSQGGLILQRFLSWMLSEGRGRELARIRVIVMLACPNGGSEYLCSLRRALGFGRHPQAASLRVLDKQVTDTQRTVIQRIVNATGTDDHQCRIPFYVYAGNADNVVTAVSAKGAFPFAGVLAGDHFSILDPTAPGNRTAPCVKHHLLTALESVAPASHTVTSRAMEDAHTLPPECGEPTQARAWTTVEAHGTDQYPELIAAIQDLDPEVQLLWGQYGSFAALLSREELTRNDLADYLAFRGIHHDFSLCRYDFQPRLLSGLHLVAMDGSVYAVKSMPNTIRVREVVSAMLAAMPDSAKHGDDLRPIRVVAYLALDDGGFVQLNPDSYLQQVDIDDGSRIHVHVECCAG
ncbi:MAG: hypothetical protein JXC32_21390 [Anaerolineae bacterium]|nr:hypothetical protein [Anaerolineae bacterium]